MFGALWNLLFFALALGILISFHEWGHYLAARAVGVRVLRFSIGFGPVLYRRQMKNGCEFAISAIPLGGYVKMLGDEQNDRRERGALPPDAFWAKNLKQRALIIAAGPAFNIILAFLFYFLVNIIGVNVLRPVVGDVLPGSRAETAALQPYDEIKSVDGEAVGDWSQTAMLFLEHINEGTPVQLTAAGELGTGPVRPLQLDLDNLQLNPGESIFDLIGLLPCQGRVSKTLTQVRPGSPAYEAGLEVGDEIVSVNGTPTPTWYRVQSAIASSQGPITLELLRGGVLYQTEVFPEQVYNEEAKAYRPLIGIGVEVEPLPELMTTRSYGPVDAALKACSDTGRMSLFIISSTWKLISGSIPAENISGPISIARGAGQSASFGFVFFISFLAAVSVNLGILNLLPIPVLDGGQLIFIAYEAVTGRAPGERIQYVLSAMGFCFIIGLSLFAVFNDLRAL